MLSELKFINFLKVLFLCGLILFVYELDFSEEFLKYGQSLPFFKGTDINTGKEIQLEKGKWTLIFYAGEPLNESISIFKYLDILFNKFKKMNFVVLGILKSTIKVDELTRVSYSIILDKDLSILKKLRVPKERMGIFLVDPELKIKFACFYFIKQEDIRLLVEQNLLGFTTHFKKFPDKIATIGEPFPLIKAIDIKSGNVIDTREIIKKFNIFVIFTPNCPRCALENYLKSLLNLQRPLINDNLSILFSSRFSLIDILNLLKSAKLNLFLAIEEIYGFEDLFYSKSYFDSEVIVAYLDEKGAITKIQDFKDFMKHF